MSNSKTKPTLNRVEHWKTQIAKILRDDAKQFAKDYLWDVLDDITKNNRITDKQIQAIKNIKYGDDPYAITK